MKRKEIIKGQEEEESREERAESREWRLESGG
jgi:hypothetical protein